MDKAQIIDLLEQNMFISKEQKARIKELLAGDVPQETLDAVGARLEKAKNAQTRVLTQIVEQDEAFLEKLKHSVFEEWQSKQNNAEEASRAEEAKELLDLEAEMAALTTES